MIAALVGIDDLDLDGQIPDDNWTIHQIIEHTLYWERHSIDNMAEGKLIVQVSPDGGYPEEHDAYRGAGALIL